MSKSRSERNPRARSAGPRRSAAGRARASGSGPRKVSPGTLVALAAIVLAVAALLVYSSTQNRLHPALARAVERYPSEGANHVPTGQRSEEHTLNSSHVKISYAVFCLKKKSKQQ